MKKLKLLTAISVVMFSVNMLQGQFVTQDEATHIANNWIQMVIDKYGHWSDSDNAIAQATQEFKSEDQLIGYYCPVNPKGYILISLRKELAPVKAYSDRFDLDLKDEKGMTDLLKSNMKRIIDTIESQLGDIETINESDLANIVEIDYRQNWNFIDSYLPGTIQKNIKSTDNYQEGEILTSSIWHQGPPYNNDCINLGCTTTSNGRALVGCVATAGAQIMKYWNWPPYGVGTGYNDTYNWPHMLDNATTSSTSTQQAAVAELNQEIGIAVAMNYGCDASGAYTWDMVGVYENQYRYSTDCGYTYRSFFNPATWFDLIKGQINSNRPIQYRVPGHSIVCDGWQEFGDPLVRQYHMNYGWANGYTTWYTLDALHLGNPSEEYLVLNIVPINSIGSSIGGIYTTLAFPYRYFDRDAIGSSATFNSGQNLQILPDMVVTGNGTSTYLRFYGSSGQYTRIYSHGDPNDGITITGGALRLRNGGSIKLP